MTHGAWHTQAGEAERAGTCHVVCAGDAAGLEVHPKERDLVIAADGGFRSCIDAHVPVDVFVGDCDSLPEGALARFAGETVVLPREKDDTDTIAALRMGLDRGYKNFAIHAALGGDIGHELANIQALAFVREHGARATLYGATQSVTAIYPEDETVAFDVEPRTRVSVFAFGKSASGVTERGLAWELDGAVLEACYPIGVSNESRDERISFSVKTGALLVVIG